MFFTSQHSTAYNYSILNLLNLLTHLFDELPSRRVVGMSTEGDFPERIMRNWFINRLWEKQKTVSACVYNNPKEDIVYACVHYRLTPI